ncbi:hypothetical protein J5X84_25860 [Streptosporangiaceae bacterium NEAU-GS5]|nr:hypothetical protein [Streptosporangiaceae bacterium NEAU-GS5]
MRNHTRHIALIAAATSLCVTGAARPSTAQTQQARCTIFPADNFWHANVSKLPRSRYSAAWVASIGAKNRLKGDFGSGIWDGEPFGVPITDVPAGTKKVKVRFTWADESDRGPYPLPRNTRVENGPRSTGDRHVLAFDRTACVSYELYNARPQSGGTWKADSGAIFNLRSNKLRPTGWTSADAAGLSMLAPLVKYDEVASGVIDHALRVTVPRVRNTFIWPASHHVGSATSSALPPMGAWFRLKASVNISRYPKPVRVILQALKTHGAIVADIGSAWYITGTQDNRWNNDAIAALGSIRGSDFEAVDASSLMAARRSGAVAQ